MEWKIRITWWIVFCIRNSKLFWINLGEKSDNPLIKIYANKIENRIKFQIKTGYYLKFLTPETIKLLESNKSKITKDKFGENVLNLEITDVVCMFLSCHVRVPEWIHTL